VLPRLVETLNNIKAFNQDCLSVYVAVGDGGLDFSYELVRTLCRAGADVIELGVPFSDPMADGPVIQAACQRSLAAGTSLKDVLGLAAELRRQVENPLVLMGYYNPFYAFGLKNLAETAAAAGIDALIVPDLPPEESGPLLQELDRRQLGFVPLVAPTTTPKRLPKLIASAKGFVYCVSVTGVTGTRRELSGELPAFLGRVRQATKEPLLVGFGVSTPEQAKELKGLADGVVVGSAVVEVAARGAAALPDVENMVRNFKQALT